MKKLLLPAITLLILFSCNNDKKESAVREKTLVDSLQNDVDDGHLAGMAKMGKLTRLQQKTAHLLDSINKLPAKAQTAATVYKAKLEDLLKDLNYADFAMNKWMEEFYSKDSSIKIPDERVKFLQNEKDKVAKVKEAILGSLQKADSVLNGL